LVTEPAAERRQLRHLEQPVAPILIVTDAVNRREERNVLVDAEVAVKRKSL